MKKTFLFLLALMMPMMASADEVIDGIQYYCYTYNNVNYAQVKGYETGLTIANIPGSVTSGGKQYTVTSIGQSAFANCSTLTSVTFPNSMVAISDYAFSGCTSLTSITIPSGMTESIGNAVFQGCTSLSSIVVDTENTKYDSRDNCNAIIETSTKKLIAGCRNTTIPTTVRRIGESAFSGLNNLTSIDMPSSVFSIERYAFGGTGLTSVDLSNVTSIGDYAFVNCTGLTSVTTKASIGRSAFQGCTGLTSFTMTSGTTIGDYAFYECSNLTYVAMPNKYLTSIGESAFYHTSVKSVTIPSSVTSIGDWAFVPWGGLTSVTVERTSPCTITNNTFPGSWKATLYVPQGRKASYEAANYWKDFEEIVENPIIVFADANVKAICIAHWDLSGDGELSMSEAAAVTTLSDYFKDNTSITSFDELSYFTGLTSIGNYAFSGCTGLTSVTIPNSVTSIVDGAFRNCSGLTSITISNNVTSIGDEAFVGCTGFTSVTIPNSVMSIGYQAFHKCSHLTSVTIPNSVTSIGEMAFFDCHLTSVTIPNSVTSIGDKAFSHFVYNSNITSIIVESGNTKYDSRNNCNAIIETANNKLVAGCRNTTIPNSVTSIGNGAFSRCSFTSVTIPNSVTSIGNDAFYRCYNLISVTIPNSVTSIGNNAFNGCFCLASVTIPNSVTSIGAGAFQSCPGLTSVTIPNSVTSIGNKAFEGCPNLTSVTIGSGVASIGDMAFNDCSNLISVTVNISTPLTITGETFSNRAHARLYVPAESVTAYKNADYWKHFYQITVIAKDMSSPDITINPISAVTYNGSAQTPTVTVKDGSTTLTNGTHYTVSYSNNTNVGTATVTITGMGSYTGTKSANFTINPKNASNLTINSIAAVTYNGSAQTPAVTVMDGSTTLTSGTHYTVSYSNNINAGTATVTITGMGNYTGTKNANFTINAKSASCLTISSIAAQTYSGSAKTPTVTVMDGSTTLTSGTDYTVAYSNNTNAGTATVTITGMGNYTGTKNANFTINKAPLTITAKSYTVTKGDPLPTFDCTYSGFQNGETESVLTTLPTITCAATDSETPGVYDITPSGAAATNYSFNYVKGTLTINANVTIAMRTGSGDARNLIAYSSKYGLDFSSRPEIKAYIACGYNWKKEVMLVHVNVVPPYTGMVIRTSNSIYDGGEYEVPITTEDYYYSNLLVPVVETQTVTPTETIYNVDYTNFSIGTLNGGDIGFVKIPSNWTTHNKSYLRVPTSLYNNTPSARELGGFGIEFVEGDEATAIQNIKNDALENDGDYYDLQGRKVKPLSKGIYIHNGKKVFVK